MELPITAVPADPWAELGLESETDPVRRAATVYPTRWAADGRAVSLVDLLDDFDRLGITIAWTGKKWVATPPPVGPGLPFADQAALQKWSRSRVDPVRQDLLDLLRHVPAPSESGSEPAEAPQTVQEGLEDQAGTTAAPAPDEAPEPLEGATTGTVHVAWTPPPIEMVEHADTLRRVLAKIARQPLVGLDVETAPQENAPVFAMVAAGLDPHRGRIRLLQIATPERVYLADTFHLPLPAAADALRDWLADQDSLKETQNGKFDLQMIRAALGGAPLPGAYVGDTMLYDQLLACGRPQAGGNGLRAIAWRHLGVELPKEQQTSDWSAPELAREQLEYAARDAAVLLPLGDVLRRKLQAEGLTRVAEIEDGCLPAVADLEYAGFGVDLPYWRGLTDEVRAAFIAARAKVLELIGGFGPVQATMFGDIQQTVLNLDSPAQVRKALARVGVDVPSTDDDVLRPLIDRYPAVSALLEYRKQSKLLGTYCLPYLEAVHPVTGRIHAHYQQINKNGVGRFSCYDPNIQQVPRDKRFRKGFVATEGRVLVLCDLSAIEMRIMAKLSGDAELIRIFQEGADPHRHTASVVTGKPEPEVSKDERQMAKPVNFGFIYGMGSSTFRLYAKNNYNVDVTEEQAAEQRRAFFRAYPGIAAFHRHQDTVARPKREVCTLSGRMRRWPHDRMPLTQLANTPDQGTGADAFKRAMARVRPHLIRLGADLVASVHDELVCECHKDVAEELADVLRREMIAAAEEFIAPVPADAEAGIGQSWADKH